MECWASPLGGCSGKQSREHLVSAGLFESLTVRVGGFPWCKDEPKTIALASLTSKILCTRHNNDLSDVDEPASAAFSTLREATRLYNVRSRNLHKRWTVWEPHINGKLLERWFLKTAINLCVVTGSHLRWVGLSFPADPIPPELLVKAAFGLEELAPHWGLHAAARPGQSMYSDDTVGFAPLIEDQAFIIGGLFTFRGHRFVLWLHEKPLPRSLRPLNLHDQVWKDADLHFHPHEIGFVLEGKLSHRVIIQW